MHRPSSRNIAIAFALRVTLAALGCASLAALVAPRAFAGDVKVNLGEGQYRRYNEQMLDFMHRKDELFTRLNALNVQDYYCKGQQPSQLDVLNDLNAIQDDYNQLMNDYRKFKQALRQLASDHPTMLTGFSHDQMTPENPNFWNGPDREMGNFAPEIAKVRAQLNRARTIDCTKPQPKTTPTPPSQPLPPPPPTWPPVTPSEPLTGLTRPPTDTVAIPPFPDHFCSFQDDRRWWTLVFQPAYDRAYRAASAALGYRADLGWRDLPLVQKIYELRNEAKPGTVNPNLLADLIRQEAIVKKEIDAYEPIAQQMAHQFYGFMAAHDRAMKIPTIDCTPKATAENPTPPEPRPGEPGPLSRPYPHLPPYFCSKEEQDRFVKLVESLIEQAEWQAINWKEFARTTGNPADAEMARQAQLYLDMLKSLLDEVRNLKVKDCTKETQTTAPPPSKPKAVKKAKIGEDDPRYMENYTPPSKPKTTTKHNGNVSNAPPREPDEERGNDQPSNDNNSNDHNPDIPVQIPH
jgi:hypothetical protein